MKHAPEDPQHHVKHTPHHHTGVPIRPSPGPFPIANDMPAPVPPPPYPNPPSQTNP